MAEVGGRFSAVDCRSESGNIAHEIIHDRTRTEQTTAMIEIYWGCLIGGAIFAVATLLFGDIVGADHDIAAGHHDGSGFLKPAVIVSAIAIFGGAGVTLTRLTHLGGWTVGLLAGIAAVLAAVAVYFLYIKPMMRSENSVGFSMNDLVGKIGNVITPIPGKGHGEVMIRVGASNTNQIAASIDNTDIPAGATVVVVEIDRERVYVASIDPA